MTYISNEDGEFLRNVFKEKLKEKVKIVFFFNSKDSFHNEAKELLGEIPALSDKIKLEIFDFTKSKEAVEKYKISRTPAIALIGKKDYGIRYYGVPLEQEFESLIEGIIYVSTEKTEFEETTKKALRELKKPEKIIVLTTDTCTYCPTVVQTAMQFAVESEMISVDIIDISEFPEVREEFSVLGVPKLIIPGKGSLTGARADEWSILELIKR